jgi:glycerol-3-phosphate dehydrogenase
LALALNLYKVRRRVVGVHSFCYNLDEPNCRSIGAKQGSPRTYLPCFFYGSSEPFMQKIRDVIIIGCGVVGAATAYALARYDVDVLILEKENDVSSGTSKANSAILHAGYDPRPGSLMATLNVAGSRLSKTICHDLNVPYINCGSLVLAFSDADLITLESLLERGRQNGVEGLEILPPERLFELEPKLSRDVKGALLAPTAAIVNPWEFTLAMAENAVENGTTLRLNEKVTAIRKVTDGYEVETNQDVHRARFVINAAGAHADTIHNMIAPPAFRIIPDKGAFATSSFSVRHLSARARSSRRRPTAI